MPKLTFETLLDAGELSPRDLKELQGVLSNKSVQRALGHVLFLAESRDKLSTLDLAGPGGLELALRQQGIVEGLRLAVETITDLVEETSDE